MRLEVLNNFAHLQEFRSEWRRFSDTIKGLTPFQSPDWLLIWWRHFGGGTLRVLVFREEDELTGIIPLFLHEWNGRRQLTLIGSGISDYLEPAIAPERREAVLAALRTYLLKTKDWEICDWQDLAADTPLARLGRLSADTPCSEIALTGEFEQYWARRSKDLRRNLRRYGHRAEETGAFEFSVTCKADSALIGDLIRLHGERWEKQGQPGMLVANRSAEFLCDAALEFEGRQLLRIFSLRYRGEVAAASIGFVCRNTLYSYLSAFDPQHELLGFGRRLLYESLRYGYRQRYTAWNFCRGEEPYKFSFGADRIPKCRLTMTREELHRA